VGKKKDAAKLIGRGGSLLSRSFPDCGWVPFTEQGRVISSERQRSGVRTQKNGKSVQVGYTCDSTLCTTVGLGQDLPLPLSITGTARAGLIGAGCSGIQDIDGLQAITQLEELAQCSCCASQVCGCAGIDDINAATQSEISSLNQAQEAIGITPQCQLNDTLCGDQSFPSLEPNRVRKPRSTPPRRSVNEPRPRR
jgi:hypothetical protein